MATRTTRAALGMASLIGVPLALAAHMLDFTPWKLATPAPVADGRPAELDGWKELSCANCHAQIAAEWASSQHASAWVSTRYQEEILEKSRPESCHGCHAPEPLFKANAEGAPPQKPKPRDLAKRTGTERDLDAHFGVTCATCHLAHDGSMLGPFGAKNGAHASTQHALFTADSKSELCIACHATSIGPVIGIAKDFVDTDQAAKGKSCVACHMQPLERPIAEQKDHAAFPVRAGRSHALQTPRDPSFLRRAFAFRAEARDGQVVVIVANECGHRVPGLIDREIALAAELLDGASAVTARGSIVIQKNSSLPADGKIEIALAGQGVRVKLHGLHEAPGFADKVSFLDETIEVGK